MNVSMTPNLVCQANESKGDCVVASRRDNSFRKFYRQDGFYLPLTLRYTQLAVQPNDNKLLIINIGGLRLFYKCMRKAA